MKVLPMLLLAGCVWVMCAAPRAASEEQQGPMRFPVSCAGMPVEIAGLAVTPHVYSDEILYRKAPAESVGALVRIVLRHTQPEGSPIALELRFNGQTPAALVKDKAWAWCEMPGDTAMEEAPYRLAPGRHAVVTFNGRDEAWGVGTAFTLGLRDGETGTEAEARLRLEPEPLRFVYMAFLSEDRAAIRPDTVVAHVANEGAAGARLESVRFHQPGDGGYTPFLTLDDLPCFTDEGRVPPGGWNGFEANVPPMPLVRGLAEVRYTLDDGAGRALWAPLFFKRERFDIGCGWMDIPACQGVSPFTRESFLKLMVRMHVNLAHVEHLAGYTDSAGPDGLYTRYPMRLMAGFTDVERYNSDAWVARIHGVDRLGEPQMGMTPMETHEALRHYRDARYPTTVTLSEDKGFRYWAGLSDFPHFDAYRVSAPAADAWGRYTRWRDGKRVHWGAPMEGIGEMMRTLHAISRPKPISLWSQNVHEGWGGQMFRKRKSPTPDEILLQAYQGLANGTVSLYWYSLQSWSLLKWRDVIGVTTRIGREMRLLEDLYLRAAPYHHERVNDADGFPMLDLNVLVTPRAAVLFAMDLDYYPDRDAKVFAFREPRPVQAAFPLPAYLRAPAMLLRVDAGGLHDVSWEAGRTGVLVRDTLDRVAVYVATRDADLRAALEARLGALREHEKAVGFDPGGNDADFAKLVRDLGCSLEDYPPGDGGEGVSPAPR